LRAKTKPFRLRGGLTTKIILLVDALGYHLVENCIQRLKEWRRIATRYDKTDTSFCAFIHLSAALRAIT